MPFVLVLVVPPPPVVPDVSVSAVEPAPPPVFDALVEELSFPLLSVPLPPGPGPVALPVLVAVVLSASVVALSASVVAL